MTKIQFFNLISGLQMGALCDNMLLENTNGGTVSTVFSPYAMSQRVLEAGCYIWIWSDDNSDVEYIDNLIKNELHIQNDVVADWIGWNDKAEVRRNFILLVDKFSE